MTTLTHDTTDKHWQIHFDAKLDELGQNKLLWFAQAVSTIGSFGRLVCYVTVFTVVFSALFLMVTFLLYGGNSFVWAELQAPLRMILLLAMILSTMGCMAVNIGKFHSVMHREARQYANDVAAQTNKRQYIEYIVDEKLRAINRQAQAEKGDQA